MSALTSIIKFFFGSKADKDRKEIQPYVDKIKAIIFLNRFIVTLLL